MTNYHDFLVINLSKYSALGKFLQKVTKNTIILSFQQIEEILGFDLPPSARKHRAWWSNDKTHSHALSSWLNVGSQVTGVDFGIQQITFVQTPPNSRVKIFPPNSESSSSSQMTPKEFEKFSQISLSPYFGVELSPRKKPDWPKLFDLVSADYQIIGDAKYYSMVRGVSIPPAKFSTIAEHVWFLEKISAQVKFLVFGNDIRVPQAWLQRYGNFVSEVEFYFLSDDGKIQRIRFIPK